jgi:hypothetical protein
MAENPSNHVLVDLDVERQGDLLGDSRTAPAGITLLHFDDRADEFCARKWLSGWNSIFSETGSGLLCNRMCNAKNFVQQDFPLPRARLAAINSTAWGPSHSVTNLWFRRLFFLGLILTARTFRKQMFFASPC